MKRIKPLLNLLPEFYLLLSAAYYWILTGTLLNPIGIVLVIVFLLQLFLQQKTMGIILSILFILLNLFMVLALISELNEFTSFDNRAKQLLLFGALYLGFNLTSGMAMLVKYAKNINRLVGTDV